MTQTVLIDKLYSEMAVFSFLTKYIFGSGIEEVNINSWDDIVVQYYEAGKIRNDPKEMTNYILNNLHGLTFPGWKPERMAKLDELFEKYKSVTKEKLWENLKYFLEAIMPICRETGIKMAIHPDDPPWDIFGLPRLLIDEESIDRFLKTVDDPHNCLTLCSGSLNANPEKMLLK